MNAIVKHIITRISIPTADRVAFGRHRSVFLGPYRVIRVRGVEGSCAKHLTIYGRYAANIFVSIPSPLTLSSQA